MNNTLIRPIATSKEELALICDVVSKPASDDCRFKYAEWLQAHGDNRGDFLRNFVKCASAGEVAQGLSQFPREWNDALGLTLTEKLTTAGLSEWRHQILSLARPALRIEADEPNFDAPPETPCDIGATRLGGDPDLENGRAYPATRDGEPMHFIGQFSCSDLISTIVAPWFPSQGLISVFRPPTEYPYCEIATEDFQKCVVYAPHSARLVRTPRSTSAVERLAPYRHNLRFFETLKIPGEYALWPDCEVPAHLVEALDKIFPTNLGGLEYQLFGHVTHGNTGDEPLIGRPDWVQLLLIPPNEGPDYGCSDLSLSYHLPASDLRLGNFSRVEITNG
jgi:uncharacterized protein (TIGR02996 family)